MNASTTVSAKQLLYCRCAYAKVVPESVKDEVLDQLCESGQRFETVSDLCEMAAHRDPRLKTLAESQGGLKIAACYPRVVKGLFQQCGITLEEDHAEILNMRTDAPAQIVERMLEVSPD